MKLPPPPGSNDLLDVDFDSGEQDENQKTSAEDSKENSTGNQMNSEEGQQEDPIEDETESEGGQPVQEEEEPANDTAAPEEAENLENNGIAAAIGELNEAEKTPFEILQEALAEANASGEAVIVEVDGIIEVTETLTVSGEVTLTGGTLLRAEGMTAALVNVTGALTLENVTLDGNRENVTAQAPLVTVKSGAGLTIDEGAVLENNNNISRGTYGGAVNNKGTLTMQDGLIQNNTACESGGGVYNIGGTFIMTDGEISYNTSERWTDDKRVERIDSTGGGVCLATGSMEMSGGTISYNSAKGFIPFGGGIALGDAYANHTGAKLTMTGGTIEGNTSSGCGGGIAIWSYHEATITGGEIINNQSNADNPSYWNYSYYGGGGIYINQKGKLTLKNVEIADNTANIGGGLAACPTSDVHLYIKNGGVFYDNTVTLDPTIDAGAPELFIGNGKDIFINSKGNKVPISITSYTMNGYKYNWTNIYGELASAAELNGILTGSLLLNSGLTTEQGQQASRQCRVHITGNTSGGDKERSYGGGIGCNGTLIIGDDTTNMVLEKKVDGTVSAQDSTFDFTLAFKVDEETPYNGNITLLQNGESNTVKPSENGELRLTLKADEYVVLSGLPVDITYTITEGKNLADRVTITHTTTTGLDKLEPEVNTDEIEGSEITDKVVNGTLNEILYTNTYNTAYTSLTVNKVWANDTETDRPESITVQLYDNGEASGEPVALNAENGWSYTWTNLKVSDHNWTVGEINVPEGYTSAQETKDGIVTITNTFIPKGSLVLQKIVNSDAPAEAMDKIYTFVVTGPNDYSETVKLKAGEFKTLENLTAGKYTVNEIREGTTIDQYTLDVTGEGTVEVANNTGASITITNTYRPLPGGLTIRKVVSGISSEAYEKTYYFNVSGPNGYSNRVSITGSGSVTISDLVPGAYTVTEEDATIGGYVLNVTGEGTVEVPINSGAEIIIRNDYEPPYRPDRPEEPEEPDEELPDEPTPLTPPDEEIPEDPTPLAPPEEEEEEEIPEEDIPLVDAPKTGSSHHGLMAALAALLGLGAAAAKKRKDDNI